MATVSEEKDLLTQIDEFRQRAEMLQSALASNQEKATALEQIVTEREVKAAELEQEIQAKEAQANVFTEVVRQQMNVVMEQLTCEIGKFDETLKKNVSDVTASLSDMNEKLEKVEATTVKLPEYIHKESVQVYRNTHELVKHLEEHVDYIDEVDRHVKKAKAPAVVAAIFGVLSFVGVAFVALLSMGYIQF